MNKIKVSSSLEGLKKAKELLYKNCDKDTVLFLSGGSTPKTLYEDLAKEKKLKAGAIALVDERYVPNSKFKIQNSKLNFTNENMIEETGLFKYFEGQNVPVFNILNGHDLDTITREYQGVISQLLKSKNKIAVMGIGTDGHTAGLPPGVSNFKFLISNDLVTSVNNFPGEFKERISLTFKALQQMDLLIVLAFGEEKKLALEQMLSIGSIEEIPARFFNKEGISGKTILITDQII